MNTLILTIDSPLGQLRAARDGMARRLITDEPDQKTWIESICKCDEKSDHAGMILYERIGDDEAEVFLGIAALVCIKEHQITNKPLLDHQLWCEEAKVQFDAYMRSVQEAEKKVKPSRKAA